MRKVQVIGLPGAGKTTAIVNFIANNQSVDYLDIRGLGTGFRQKQFRDLLVRAVRDTIGESACGVSLSESFIVRLDRPIQEIYSNCLARDGYVDEDYLSLLSHQMVRPDYTVGSSEDLISLFEMLFRGKNGTDRASGS